MRLAPKALKGISNNIVITELENKSSQVESCFPNNMDILNDDAIKCIGQYTGILYGAESYVYFASTCKRMRKLLLLPTTDYSNADQTTGGVTNNKIIETIIRIRVADWIGRRYNLGIFFPTNVSTLEQLAIFEKWLTETNFISDNRIKFPFASTEMNHICTSG